MDRDEELKDVEKFDLEDELLSLIRRGNALSIQGEQIEELQNIMHKIYDIVLYMCKVNYPLTVQYSMKNERYAIDCFCGEDHYLDITDFSQHKCGVDIHLDKEGNEFKSGYELEDNIILIKEGALRLFAFYYQNKQVLKGFNFLFDNKNMPLLLAPIESELVQLLPSLELNQDTFDNIVLDCMTMICDTHDEQMLFLARLRLIKVIKTAYRENYSIKIPSNSEIKEGINVPMTIISRLKDKAESSNFLDTHESIKYFMIFAGDKFNYNDEYDSYVMCNFKDFYNYLKQNAGPTDYITINPFGFAGKCGINCFVYPLLNILEETYHDIDFKII